MTLNWGSTMKEHDLIHCLRCTPAAGELRLRAGLGTGECELCEDNGVIKEGVGAAYRLGGLRAAIACPLCYDPDNAPWELRRWEFASASLPGQTAPGLPLGPMPVDQVFNQPNRMPVPCILHAWSEAPPPSVARAFESRSWGGVTDIVGPVSSNMSEPLREIMTAGTVPGPMRPPPEHMKVLFQHKSGFYTYAHRY